MCYLFTYFTFVVCSNRILRDTKSGSKRVCRPPKNDKVEVNNLVVDLCQKNKNEYNSEICHMKVVDKDGETT